MVILGFEAGEPSRRHTNLHILNRQYKHALFCKENQA
jgi:hypothetical protein